MIAREQNANTIIASNLILIIPVLGLINYIHTVIYTGVTLRNSLMLLFSLVLNISIFMLIRKGFVWFKYFMLIFMLFGVISIFIPHYNAVNRGLLRNIISVSTILINVVAVVFIFLKPKEDVQNKAVY